ncbi:MAG TPA: class I SAM-dependent methyltransferase [Candidatus Binatia bacterium]|jgi:extracellular factor (EF) 3-hydroxypalmitic acid methyl ester biosynthesis protein|nr:class I SAM-dependent methyltransferase [Candidatus Binatia bacterium]
MDDAGGKETLVTFRANQGLDMRGSLLRVSQHQIVFETYAATTVLRLSEVLEELKLFVNGQLLYVGRGIVTNLIHSGVALVCEAQLQEAWFNPELVYAGLSPERLHAEFDGFFLDWQKHFLVRREYRLFVSELQSFFHDLRLWLEHIELGLRSMPSSDSHSREQELSQELGPRALSVFTSFVDRFEELGASLEPETVPAHQAYMRRQLHPLVLCAPWVYRTVTKPLGYAGDYEMVNMMFRNAFEGASLFAKVVNFCFLHQGAVLSHRNRIDYLVQKLVAEDLRLRRAGRGLRVFSLGCGPAVEVQRFLADRPPGNEASFDLLDFNEETLQYARSAVESAARKNGSAPTVRPIKKSIAAIIKESSRSSPNSSAAQYDLIYCAGLFDYLTDQVCRRLLDAAFNRLAPGGLLVATNVTPANPHRRGMEHILDWNLVYRDAQRMRGLRPAAAPEELDACSDLSGVNIWIEIRKPSHE